MALLSKRRLILGLVVIGLCVGGGTWFCRERLLNWYYLRGLAQASESERDQWAERVASLGETAVPGLLACLAREDERTCANARAALERICACVPQDDPRWSSVTSRLAEVFPGLSAPGQRCLLALAAEWMRSSAPPSPAMAAYAVQLLEAADQIHDSKARALALELAAAVLAAELGDSASGPCRQLACACLRDGDSNTRDRAVHLALYPKLDLLAEVAPLLHDSAVEVRRSVVLAVGSSRKAISDEQLALALHDADAEVRRLCEKALRGRGLTARHIQLARLITDSQPATRAKVLLYLSENSELDVAVWLHLLTHDPAEAVRLAAIRAAAEQGIGELYDRLEQMATHDSSPTVCQWASYYLGCLKQRMAKNEAP
jgi:hypothetical protein